MGYLCSLLVGGWWWRYGRWRGLGQLVAQAGHGCQPWVDVVVRVAVAGLVGEVGAAGLAEAGAVRPAQRRDGLRERDGVADGRREVELMVVGRAGGRRARRRRVDRQAGLEVDRGQGLLLEVDADGGATAGAQAARAALGERGRRGGPGRGCRGPMLMRRDVALDGTRQPQVLGERQARAARRRCRSLVPGAERSRSATL